MTLPQVGIKTDELVPEMSRQVLAHNNMQQIYVPMDEEAVERVIRACFEEMTSF